jgi:cobaltochelatase CobT subunit
MNGLAIGLVAAGFFAILASVLASQLSRKSSPPAGPALAPPRPQVARHRGYRAFTTEFDQVAEPHSAVHDILGPMTEEFRRESAAQWREFHADTDGLKASLRIAAVQAAARIGQAMPRDTRNDIVVTLLLDHSGSLRHRPILVTALSVYAAVECLSLLGIRIEIAGFTTSAWKGGKSREKWIARGRRPGPGRLNDLLYVVYRNASDTGPLDMEMFRTMLRRDMLKENVDGEAVEWAEKRLLARRERRKLLLLVSDGAPVDDSTIYENGDRYLPRHFEGVVRRIEREGRIEAGSVMHTSPVLPTFSKSRKCHTVETLGDALLDQIEDMLLSEIAMVRRGEEVG